MSNTNQQGHPNRQLYIGFDPNSLDSAAPYVTNGLLNVAQFTYNPSTGNWEPASPQISDNEFCYTNWQALNNGTGYNKYDYIQQIDEYNVASVPAVYISTTWRNITQRTTLSGAPPATDLGLITTGVTTVSVNNFPAVQAISATVLPLPTGAATSANQSSEITLLTSIAADVSALGGIQNTLIAGQKAIATTGTAVQLGSGALVNGVTITANINNSAPMTVGPTGVTNTQTGSGNGYILQPGASMSFSISNLSPIYLNGTAGDFVSYTGN